MGLRGRLVGTAIALTLTSAALVGCGGGTKALSKADFVRKADSICSAAITRLNAITPPSDTAPASEYVANVRQTLAIIEPTVTQLSALAAAPADFAVLEQNLIAPTKDLVTASHAFIGEIQQANGDSAAEQAAIEKIGQASDDPNQATHDKALADYGFDGCSKTNSGTTPASTTTTTIKPPPPYVAGDSSFSAVFPVTPTRESTPISAAGLSLETILYTAVTTDEELSVAYVPFPAAPAADRVQAALDNSIDQGAAGAKGTVDSRSRITYLGAPAEDAVITSPGHVIHVRVVLFGRKFYVLQGITYSADAPHPQYDELLATFHTI
ncbi:MAG: hypothetical protein QOF30_3134 [Acidimicrobiaceae bacterium]|jgi:hypothetical protein|nr:hypothetical protein [Acidimicrobiaceae bacterium]